MSVCLERPWTRCREDICLMAWGRRGSPEKSWWKRKLTSFAPLLKVGTFGSTPL